MGEDNLKSLHKWKTMKLFCKIMTSTFIQDSKLKDRTAWSDFIWSRNLELKNHPKIHIIDATSVEISSTFIRNNLKEGKTFSRCCPSKVWEYIDHNIFIGKLKQQLLTLFQFPALLYQNYCFLKITNILWRSRHSGTTPE
jgi:nicotinate-nucleotide adenylyltransferase